MLLGTLAICYGLLYGTGTSAYDSVASTIVSTTKASAYSAALDISSSINQQLLSVGQSVCLGGSKYASVLFDESASSLLISKPSYKEFKFLAGCKPPNCPSDFGTLSSRSRIPYISGYVNGSLLDSSVYLYSSDSGSSARDDVNWQTIVTANPIVQKVIDDASYQDIDLRTLYSEGVNSTMFFYNSAQVFVDGGGYVAVHRTFPGMNKGNDIFYNPPARSWFSHAPGNHFIFLANRV